MWLLSAAVLCAHIGLLGSGVYGVAQPPWRVGQATQAQRVMPVQLAAASPTPPTALPTTPPSSPPAERMAPAAPRAQTAPEAGPAPALPSSDTQAAALATPGQDTVPPDAQGDPRLPGAADATGAPPPAGSESALGSGLAADKLAPARSEAASATAASAPVRVPPARQLTYALQGQAKGFNYSARGELLWLPAGQRYEARLEISAFLLGSRVQTSRGELTPRGLQPQRFSDKVRSEVAAHFDWDQRRVIFSANTPSVDLQDGAQDHLSAFVMLAALLGGDVARYLPDGEVLMQAIGPRDADTWRWLMNGEETLALPAGTLRTYKLTRPPVKPYDLNVELWMAPDLDYLPARIRLTQHNGDFIDQQLKSSAHP